MRTACRLTRRCLADRRSGTASPAIRLPPQMFPVFSCCFLLCCPFGLGPLVSGHLSDGFLDRPPYLTGTCCLSIIVHFASLIADGVRSDVAAALSDRGSWRRQISAVLHPVDYPSAVRCDDKIKRGESKKVNMHLHLFSGCISVYRSVRTSQIILRSNNRA